jgi:hypothetical protein
LWSKVTVVLFSNSMVPLMEDPNSSLQTG